MPTETHRAEIFETMAVTFKTRRKFISEMAPSITEVLNLYPKFMEFDGDLIDAEFSRMFPNCGTLLGKFPSFYTPRILKYCKEKRLDIYERYKHVSDENLSACLMLSDMLPVTGLRKKLFTEAVGKKLPADCIVRFYGENSDLMEGINSTARSGIQQPYLMSQGSTENNSYFLVLDKKILNVGSCGIKAIDKLHKAHFVFDVQYEKQCSLFFAFLENYIYKTYKGPVKSIVETLHMLIERIVIDC